MLWQIIKLATGTCHVSGYFWIVIRDLLGVDCMYNHVQPATVGRALGSISSLVWCAKIEVSRTLSFL